MAGGFVVRGEISLGSGMSFLSCLAKFKSKAEPGRWIRGPGQTSAGTSFFRRNRTFLGKTYDSATVGATGS